MNVFRAPFADQELIGRNLVLLIHSSACFVKKANQRHLSKLLPHAKAVVELPIQPGMDIRQTPTELATFLWTHGVYAGQFEGQDVLLIRPMRGDSLFLKQASAEEIARNTDTENIIVAFEDQVEDIIAEKRAKIAIVQADSVRDRLGKYTGRDVIIVRMHATSVWLQSARREDLEFYVQPDSYLVDISDDLNIQAHFPPLPLPIAKSVPSNGIAYREDGPTHLIWNEQLQGPNFDEGVTLYIDISPLLSEQRF